MNIASLLAPEDNFNTHTSIRDEELMALWTKCLKDCGFNLRPAADHSKLTDAILEPMFPTVRENQFLTNTPLHIKIIGRHMNGSFRCHIGIGKASRPICSSELDRDMRLLAVFFRPEKSKSPLVSPDFILFPTWLLHLFRYTRHANTPGRTDVRFLESEMLTKEDHIYRLNHVINTLFRFNLYDFDASKLRTAVELANFLFDVARLDEENLPPPEQGAAPHQPSLYPTLFSLLNSPRPPKTKPICHNCNSKPASRRKLCVACYRYLLKHGEPRPLRLIIASRHNSHIGSLPSSTRCCYADALPTGVTPVAISPPVVKQPYTHCGIQYTHQCHHNLNGDGHWCETCKRHSFGHNRVHTPDLFVREAKHKVNVQSLSNWSTLFPAAAAAAAAAAEEEESSSVSTSPIEEQPVPFPNTWAPCKSQRGSPSSDVSSQEFYTADEVALASKRASSPWTLRPIQLPLYKPFGHFYEPAEPFAGRFQY